MSASSGTSINQSSSSCLVVGISYLSFSVDVHGAATRVRRIAKPEVPAAGSDHDRTAGLRVSVSYLRASRAPTSHEPFRQRNTLDTSACLQRCHFQGCRLDQ